MLVELPAAAAAWLAHVLWYAADPLRWRRLGLAAEPSTGLLDMGRSAAVAVLGLGLMLWVRAHGSVIGACCALAALTAAASINTLLAPLWPRVVIASGALAAALLFLALLEVCLGE